MNWRRPHHEKMLLECDYKCFYCKSSVSLHPKKGSGVRMSSIDHVIPLSRGGLDRKENWVIACRACNTKKAAKSVKEFTAHEKRKKRF